MAKKDGATCPGCGLPNYEGLCPHCRGDQDAYERELVPPFHSSRDDDAPQTGFYGMVNNPTAITVGEAGAEQVAILRNPRQMMWNGGGGGQEEGA